MNFFRKKLKPASTEDLRFKIQLAKILGFKPRDLSVYKKAFTHSSVKKTNSQGKPINYERLEFLGDAVIGTVIADYLFKNSPFGDEGYLTQMRSKIVSRVYLNEIGKKLNLIQFVKSAVNKDRYGDNIYGNVFEALVGAIYIDRGFNYCRNFILNKLIKPYVNINKLEQKITSYKRLLIEWCQKEKKEINFEIFEDSGNNQLKYYSVKLFINGKLIAKGRDTSKKRAEEKAAKRSFYVLQKKIENA